MAKKYSFGNGESRRKLPSQIVPLSGQKLLISVSPLYPPSHLRISLLELAELALAEGSTAGHDENDGGYGQEKEQDSIHQQSLSWIF
jgi:hypothetical protein